MTLIMIFVYVCAGKLIRWKEEIGDREHMLACFPVTYAQKLSETFQMFWEDSESEDWELSRVLEMLIAHLYSRQHTALLSYASLAIIF